MLQRSYLSHQTAGGGMSAEDIRAAMRAAEDEGDAAAAAAVEKEAAAEMDEFTKVGGRHASGWGGCLNNKLRNAALCDLVPCKGVGPPSECVLVLQTANSHSRLPHHAQEPLALPSEAGEAGDDTTTRDSAGGAVAGAAGAGGAATSRERTPGAAVGGAAAAAEAVAAAEEDDMMKDMAALAGEGRGRQGCCMDGVFLMHMAVAVAAMEQGMQADRACFRASVHALAHDTPPYSLCCASPPTFQAALRAASLRWSQRCALWSATRFALWSWSSQRWTRTSWRRRWGLGVGGLKGWKLGVS